MRIVTTISGDLSAQMADEAKVGERVVSGVVTRFAGMVQSDWRNQVRGAGLGGRLANAIRNEVYPASRPSLNAAALVFSRAPEILSAFERGAVIRSADGFWLAIPLPVAGRGPRGRKMTPGEWEQRTGRALRFVYRRGRTALLVDEGTVKTGARVMGRDGYSRAARGFRNRTVPVFVLVPQVRLSKRLDLLASADRITGGIPRAIASEWR